jgi:hypothetical protein
MLDEDATLDENVTIDEVAVLDVGAFEADVDTTLQSP